MAKLKLISLLIFLLADLTYSFYQHYHTPLYGDLADIVVPIPEKGYYKVLHDPFGSGVLLDNEIYPNPNRFFAHWSVAAYFLNMPLILQKLTSPIESVYISAAIFKILVQALMIYLLAAYISCSRNILNSGFLIAAAIITPLFQTAGFVRSLGIIDPSVVYTFFYALPLGLLLLIIMPFFQQIFYGKSLKFNPLLLSLAAFCMIFLTLHGPLLPGVVLIIFPMVIFSLWRRNFISHNNRKTFTQRVLDAFRKIPATLLLFFLWSCALSLYSLYIGRNNELNFGDTLPVADRYAKLPLGIWKLIIKKLGFPLILLVIFFNMLLIKRRFRSAEGDKILRLLGWIGLFALIYTLLLPLGGFRVYRENIIRYDTIMPVTVGLFLMFGMSSFYLVRRMKAHIKTVYISGLILILAIFMNADRLNVKPYECERKAMEMLSEAKGPVVVLESDCPVMDWRKPTDCNQTLLIATLLYRWNVTDEVRLFCFKEGEKK